MKNTPKRELFEFYGTSQGLTRNQCCMVLSSICLFELVLYLHLGYSIWQIKRSRGQPLSVTVENLNLIWSS